MSSCVMRKETETTNKFCCKNEGTYATHSSHSTRNELITYQDYKKYGQGIPAYKGVYMTEKPPETIVHTTTYDC